MRCSGPLLRGDPVGNQVLSAWTWLVVLRNSHMVYEKERGFKILFPDRTGGGVHYRTKALTMNGDT